MLLGSYVLWLRNCSIYSEVSLASISIV